MGQPATITDPNAVTHPYSYWINYGFRNGEGACEVTRSAPIANAADVDTLTDLISERVGTRVVIRTWQQFPTAGH